jgi:[ribosomal protein S5]-alanine N-acetyltransferase
MSAGIPSITTSRLLLRPLEAADAGALHRIYQVEGVLQYFPNPTPPPLEKVQKFVAGQEKHWAEYGYGNWGILPEGESQIIGWVGLQYVPELNETEVGYLLSQPFWGLGYATEAARASLQFGFEHFDLDHIIALVHPDNLGSRRVIEKCGMTYMENKVLWGLEMMRYCVEKTDWKVEKTRSNVRD